MNARRQLEGAVADAKRNADHAVRGPSSPLAGTIYVDRAKKPTECGTCLRKGAFMAAINRGDGECSHIDCPNRKRVTAAPCQKVSLE